MGIYINKNQAAKLLEKDRVTIYAWAKNGKLNTDGHGRILLDEKFKLEIKSARIAKKVEEFIKEEENLSLESI